MPDKLTDSEIVKALECCTMNGLCDFCYLKSDKKDCQDRLHKDALDLINRLQEEKEVLKARIGVYETCNARKDEAIRHLEAENERLNGDLIIERTRRENAVNAYHEAEAYKECIEKVKEELSLIKLGCQSLLDNEGVFAIDLARKRVDNLSKELVGDSE